MTNPIVTSQPPLFSSPVSRPLLPLAITWLVLPILLWLSVHGTFSLQNAGPNTGEQQGLVQTVTDQDTFAGRVQKAMTGPLLLAFIFPFLSRARQLSALNPLFTALGALAVASILWSQFPFRSLAFSFNAVLGIFFAFCFYTKFSAEDQLRLIYWCGVIIIGASVVAAILVPQYATQSATGGGADWTGMFHTKNVLARACVFLLTPALFSYGDHRVSRLSRCSYIILILFVTFKTGSRTGLIDAAACVMFSIIVRFLARFGKRDALLLVVFWIGVSAAGIFLILQNAPVILTAVGRNPTLSGRTAIWSAVMGSITKRPLLGYGYGGFWWGARGEAYTVDTAVGWMVPYSHNGFMDVWLDLGLIGFGLIACTFIKAVRDGVRTIRGPRSFYVQWCLSIVFLTVLYNLDEGTLLAQSELVWILYIVACTGLAVEAKRARSGLDIA
jgi:exopolysaccharide production protein ExoQ